MTKRAKELHFIVHDIRWDLEKGETAESLNLPSSCPVVVRPSPFKAFEKMDINDRWELEDHIGDILSNTYGYAHHGFLYEQVKPAQ